MKQKSLRQLAKELGVSASYLSQVKSGKRPASDKLEKALGNLSVKQNVKQNVIMATNYPCVAHAHGGVLELADRHDLGSCAARRAGSSPAFPTTY